MGDHAVHVAAALMGMGCGEQLPIFRPNSDSP